MVVGNYLLLRSSLYQKANSQKFKLEHEAFILLFHNKVVLAY